MRRHVWSPSCGMPASASAKRRGKCEGRKPHAELHPDVEAEAKRLDRASPKTGDRPSYRQISARLAGSRAS